MIGAIARARRRPAGHPARFYLAVLAFAVAAPAIIVTGYLLTRYAQAERARLEEQVRDEARMIASALDRRFASMIEALQVIAVTHDFGAEGLAEFHARASRARGILGRNVVLRDLDGRQLVNASVPWGQPLPRTIRPSDAKVALSGRPQITDVFESPIDREKIVSIVVPVMRDGKPAYLLHLAQSLSYFQTALSEVQMRPGHLALIMDTQGTVVARSREPERFAGGPGVTVGEEREGATVSHNLDGQPALTGWATSVVSGWRATASVRREIIDRPLKQALVTIASMAALMILLGFGLAWFVGSRISRSLRSLTGASAALGARAPVPEVRTPLSEVNEVGRALKDAEDRLAENEVRLEKALVAAKMYSFDFEYGGKTISRSASASAVLGEVADDLKDGSRRTLRDRVHPADLPRFVRTVEGLSPENPQYSVEFRYIRPDGEEIWLQANGVGEFLPDGCTRVTGFTRDVTSRKHAEIRQSILVRELHHRVKNNLATVLALANLSGRDAVSIADYKTKLRARIQSMARSHALLNENAFRSGFLRTLLRDELEPYAQGDDERVHVEGPDIDLPPEAALAVGMAIHELATNAGKYGSLSRDGGRVDVRWEARNEPGGEHERRRLRLVWRESGGPRVEPPARKGFGSRLLENVIGEQLKGKVELRYEPEGLVAVIEAALDGAHAQDFAAADAVG